MIEALNFALFCFAGSCLGTALAAVRVLRVGDSWRNPEVLRVFAPICIGLSLMAPICLVLLER